MLLCAGRPPPRLFPQLRAAAWAARSVGSSSRLSSKASQSSSEASVNGAGEETHAVTVSSKDVAGKARTRLDALLAARIPSTSRHRIADSVAAGRVSVNGRPAAKPSLAVKPGDRILCVLAPPPPLTASPEAIPLDVAYEDDHVMVVNKPAGMVVHVSPGHHSGTLVNALLHHCGLPAVSLAEASSGGGGGSSSRRVAAAATGGGGLLALGGDAVSATITAGPAAAAATGGQDISSRGAGAYTGEGGGSSTSYDLDEEDDDLDELAGDDEEEEGSPCSAASYLPSPSAGRGGLAAAAAAGDQPHQPQQQRGVIRPGIVHRLDKGTTGLLVVAKTETAHRALVDQFKARTVRRTYVSVTLGSPPLAAGRVDTNIDRDVTDRKRMAAYGYGGSRGRTASSRYKVLEALAGGGASLVQWNLETGRTHQIRVHAKHLGCPLLGDVTYGSATLSAANALSKHVPPSQVGAARQLLAALARPALHAQTLGFTHPATGQALDFDCDLPPDFLALLGGLRAIK